jgi:hypothetical protein
LNDDVPIVSESGELFLSRFHALTIPEIGATRPNRIAATIRTYRHLRREDEAETGGLGALDLQPIYSHLPKTAQTAGIVVTSPTRVRVDPTALRQE